MRRLTALALLLGLGACAAPAAPPRTAAPPPTASTAPRQSFVVYFVEWSAALDEAAQKVVTSAAAAAKQNPTAPVTVVGFADPAGSSAANSDISRTRAQLVTDQLTQDGVDASRIQHVGRGPTDYTASALESRRVEIDVGG